MSFEVVAQGFGLAEAPLWDGESLLFSDAIFGGVKRIGADGRVEEVLAKRRGRSAAWRCTRPTAA